MRRPWFIVLIVVGVIPAILVVNSLWNLTHQPTFREGAPTPRPAPTFVAVRPAGEVSMPLVATDRSGGAFTSSSIVTSPAHPLGVAYLAGWRVGTDLLVGSLDLASGQPLFPMVDLGTWHWMYQFSARPEGLLVAGVRSVPGADKDTERFSPTLVALDPTTGQVRWEHQVGSAGVEAVYLYPFGVLYPGGLLDWETGAARWSEDSDRPDLFTLIPAGRLPEPSLGTPLAVTTQPPTLTPDDPRVAVPHSASVLDAATGRWTDVADTSVIQPAPEQTSVLVVGDSLYVTADRGHSGDVLVRFPADPPQPVERGRGLAHGPNMQAVTACGPARLCLTVGIVGGDEHELLIDTDTGANRDLPTSVPTGGYALGDRYVDPAGRVYDLKGHRLGDGSPLNLASWVTTGSVIGVDPAGSLVAVGVADGSRTVLGQLPAIPFQAATANGYLVVATADGFHAWRFAAAV